MTTDTSSTRDRERNDLTIYDSHAEQWWSDEVRWVRTLKNMVKGRLPYFERHVDFDGAAVLDVGCAGGFMAEALARRGATVTGIDPAAKAIEAARDHAAQQGLAIDYDVGVGEELPYENERFDAVVCVDVLEHVQSVERTIAEMARVLKPGGVLCVDTINRNAIARFATITMAEDVLGLLPKGTHDPAMFIKPRELREMLNANGFEAGDFVGLGPRGLNARFDFTFGRVPGTFVIYMTTARKPGTRSTA